ncbi:dol-P-Glc:Glc(2)Man(9)GlcNAc(2)-PP-Dol alpha-1,2-glucosyltransferase-like [Gastrolobium bilobum]|uniref:dol-P-Glc:Glc(2)Man(9)GlcNAc(2)-PP-Dol alpha-1,2-glucosyltransferase-like n=1 Tax=Gastrolobium bilobum TaxID=150636 RepID=UPI002AB238D0|nr:dol-P-Glc:Glc(2)Man(9)GlcNAc(2)-PP-Dol alpha-1,2-glucosyltransferase-like [Gastrolobium bilobum]
MCSAAILRSINGVLAIICSVVLYDIITHLKPTLDERKAMLRAVVPSLYPLHWFFTFFLYYTDVASVTAVLAMYLASLKKNYWFRALAPMHFTITQAVDLFQLFWERRPLRFFQISWLLLLAFSLYTFSGTVLPRLFSQASNSSHGETNSLYRVQILHHTILYHDASP